MKWQVRFRRLIIVAALTIILLLGAVQFVCSFSEVGITYEIGTGGFLLSDGDLSAVPPLVVEDATRLATELYGDYQEKCNDFVNQLLTIYKEFSRRFSGLVEYSQRYRL